MSEQTEAWNNVAEYARQYSMQRGFDPDLVTTIWTDPKATPAQLRIRDLMALLVLASAQLANPAPPVPVGSPGKEGGVPERWRIEFEQPSLGSVIVENPSGSMAVVIYVYDKEGNQMDWQTTMSVTSRNIIFRIADLATGETLPGKYYALVFA